ncbi:MAG TPA: outer membrane beta-barrel protein [Desulfuromonadaceae bacterium]
MKRALLAAFACISALVAASPSRADVRGQEVTLSPFIGAQVFDGSQQLEPGFAAGVRLGYNLNENWGVESQFSAALPKAQDRNIYGQYGIEGDLLYHFFPEGKLVPFVVVGGGWARSETLDGTSKGPTFAYGAGMKYFVDHSVAVRIDIRQIMAFSPINKGTTDYWQNGLFTFGVSYQFGGAPVSVPPVAEQNVWLGEETRAPAGKILIRGLKVEDNALEIMASGRISYTIFTLPQPSRLVIDINDAVSGFHAPSITLNRLGIAAVRFESHPEYLRIYLDGAEGRLIPYRVEETGTGLKIIVTTP